MYDFSNINCILREHIILPAILLLFLGPLILGVLLQIVINNAIETAISLGGGDLLPALDAFGLVGLHEAGQTAPAEPVVAWVNRNGNEHDLQAHGASYLLLYTLREVISILFFLLGLLLLLCWLLVLFVLLLLGFLVTFQLVFL